MGRKGRDRTARARKGGRTNIILAGFVLVLCTCIFSQEQTSLPDSPKPQNNAPQSLPDSPRPQQNAPATDTDNSTSQPPPQQPTKLPTGPTPGSQQQGPSITKPQNEPGTPADAETPSGTAPGQAPTPKITTVPPGSAPSTGQGPQEELYQFIIGVNAVTVPVTVKDSSGYLVQGLLPADFSVYEDGVKQKISFFTSDPLPLSAAVVLDTGMPDIDFQKIRNSLSALLGAFGQFDEVSVYSYGNTVKKWNDFTSADKIPAKTLKDLRGQRGGNSTVPVIGGPLGQSGPTINGRNVADNTPNIPSMPRTNVQQASRVLNDAVLAAAQDLGRRDRNRRKVMFVISDGRELGSDASYADVMKVLLSNEIAVYGVGVGSSAIPGYRQLQKIRIPGQGYGDIMPKYASATGGEVFSEFSQSAIETAYARVTEDARNQYTIGYNARVTPSSAYRSIEVRVNRPGLRVYAKDGYYPLPPKAR